MKDGNFRVKQLVRKQTSKRHRVRKYLTLFHLLFVSSLWWVFFFPFLTLKLNRKHVRDIKNSGRSHLLLQEIR